MTPLVMLALAIIAAAVSNTDATSINAKKKLSTREKFDPLDTPVYVRRAKSIKGSLPYGSVAGRSSSTNASMADLVSGGETALFSDRKEARNVQQIGEEVWQQIGQDIEHDGDFHIGADVSMSGDGNVVALVGRLIEGNEQGDGKVRILRLLPVGGRDTWVPGVFYTRDSRSFFPVGKTVSLAANGLYAAIGNIKSSETPESVVAVFYFDSYRGAWIQRGTSVTGHGYVTSISDDGTRLAIGDPDFDNNRGRVHVTECKGVSCDWRAIPGGEIEGSEHGGQFGFSVSMGSNGKNFSVGIPGVGSGLVRAFFYDDEKQELRQRGRDLREAGIQVPGQRFGHAISMLVLSSAEGEAAFIGVGSPGTLAGRAGCYQLTEDDSWILIEDINFEGSDADGEQGSSISLAINGKFATMTVGDPSCKNANGDETGCARVYKYELQEDKSWIVSQFGRDLAGPIGADAGYSIATSDSGFHVAVGFPFFQYSQDSRGFVRVFKCVVC